MTQKYEGIQSHSIGGIFPYVLVGFGDDTWGILAPNGAYLNAHLYRFTTIRGALRHLSANRHLYEKTANELARQKKVIRPTGAANPTAPTGPAQAHGRWNWYEQLEEGAPE